MNARDGGPFATRHRLQPANCETSERMTRATVQAKGGGHEDIVAYGGASCCQLHFFNIPNIHWVRTPPISHRDLFKSQSCAPLMSFIEILRNAVLALIHNLKVSCPCSSTAESGARCFCRHQRSMHKQQDNWVPQESRRIWCVWHTASLSRQMRS